MRQSQCGHVPGEFCIPESSLLMGLSDPHPAPMLSASAFLTAVTG